MRAFNRSNPPGLLEAAAERSLMIDWERDSKGDGIVDKDDFIRSVVELAVTWCEHTDILTPEVCTEFLHDLFGKLFSDLPEQQKVQWREHYQEHHTQVSKKQDVFLLRFCSLTGCSCEVSLALKLVVIKIKVWCLH